MSVLDEVKKFTKLGIVCLPNKKPKQPGIKAWQKFKKTPFNEFPKEPDGFGFLTGKVSNITVIDVDNMDDWKLLNSVVKFDLDGVPCTKSPSGGLHYYFKYCDKIVGAACMILKQSSENSDIYALEIDTRNDRQFILVPPSIYKLEREPKDPEKKKEFNEKKKFIGKPYEWEVEFKSFDQLKEIPEDFIDLWSQKKIIFDGSIVCRNNTSNKKKPEADTENTTDAISVGDMSDCDNWSDEEDVSTVVSSVVEKKEPAITKDQFKQALSGLRKERFASYDEWCKLLWAAARWQQENDHESKEIIDLLDNFCKECPNYESRENIMLKYMDAFTRKGNDKSVNMGTVMYWLKEDNIMIFNNIHCRQDKIAEVADKVNNVKNTFTRKDNYYWSDFMAEARGRTFDSLDEAKEYILKNVQRVLAYISEGEGFYVKKDSEEKMFNIVVKEHTTNMSFKIRYYSTRQDKRTRTKKELKVLEEVSFNKFMADNNLFKIFSKMEIYPEDIKCDSRAFNIWQSFKAVKIPVDLEHKGLQRVLFILKEIWASGEESYYNYMLGWFRFLVAHPSELIKTAIFVYGRQGVGKSKLADFVKKFVVGRSLSATFRGVEQVIEKHETTKAGKKLIVIEEMAHGKENLSDVYNSMKDFVTGETIMINPKAKCIFEISNISNYILFSNNKNSVHVEERDRRYNCFEASMKFADDKVWWEETNALIDNEETGNMFYSYLLSLDEKSLPNPRAIINTKLREELQYSQAPSGVRFARDFMEEHKTDDIRKIKAGDLYQRYRAWCSTNGESAKAERFFSGDASQILFKKRYTTGNYYFTVSPKDLAKVNELSEKNTPDLF